MRREITIRDDEMLEDGTLTPAFVRNHLPKIPEDKVEDYAFRLDLFFGSGLLRRAEERRRSRRDAFRARVEELRNTGMSPEEGRRILLSEGYQC